ncbi:MAG: UPF0182 family protein [Gemmatimonadaceae bacterium]
MTPRRWLIASAIGVAALLLVGRVVADLYSSYAWYDALGATAVWRARIGTMTMLRLSAWIAASLFALGHLFTVRQSVVSLVVQRQLGDLEIAESVHGRHLTWSVVALALVMGALLALSQSDWTTAFLAGNGGAFGEYDNYFNADLGFYVFWLPFEMQLWTWTLIVVLATTAVVIALYVVTSGVRIEDGMLRVSSHARRHLTVIVGILLLMLSWDFRLQMYLLLLNGTGPGGAYGYFDHRVAQHGALILSLATLGAGIVVMVAGVNSQRIALTATACVLVLWVASEQFAPAIVRRATRDADPVVRERQYLGTQAGYSRRAYGIDRIVLDDSSAVYRSVDSALASVALWDDHTLRRAVEPRALLDTSSGWVGWRPSARGPIADVVRRTGDVNSSRDTWTITTIDAAAADPAGDIVTISDPLGRSPGGERTVHAPLVYPGAESYDIISDSSHRVVGVPINSRIARVAHAWSLQSPQFVAGALADPRPTLVAVRDVRERLYRLTPFFVQGSTITPLIVADTIYWTVDLYSASNWYPLSIKIQSLGQEWRYFQHAAVAIADGFSGDVMIVPDEMLDPLARVWVQRFQSLFTTAAALPSGLREMLPPATDQLRTQAMVFGRFGAQTTSPELRHAPDRADSLRSAGAPMALTRDRRAIATMLPLLDSADQVSGVMVNIGGARRRTAWYPSAGVGPNWTALDDRFNALDSTVTRRAPRQLHTAIRLLPTDNGFVFVQPVFSMPIDEAPAFAWVGVIEGDSLRRMSPVRRDGTAGSDVRVQVQAIYAAMRVALQRNDWIAFGRAMDALSRVAGPTGGRQ